MLPYAKLLVPFHHFELAFVRVEKQTLCSASSLWRGYTELSSARPVSRVPAAQGNETDSGYLLPAYIWQSLIFMLGPDLLHFCLIILYQHKDSCTGHRFGLDKLQF